MKYVFVGGFLAMLALSVVAALWQPVKPDDRTELVWVTDDAPTRRETIELFNKMNPEYRLVLDAQNGGEKIIVQCLAGVGPDLFDCYDPFQLMAHVKAGIALDCTEALAQRGIRIEDSWPCLTPTYVLDGRVYGHPANTSAPAIWYNKRLFDSAGVPYPQSGWTWNDLIETAQRLNRRDSAGRPAQFGIFCSLDVSFAKVLIRQWDGRIYTPEGTRCVLDTPEVAAAIQFAQDLMFKYRITPTFEEEAAMATSGGWGSGAISLFAEEKGAMAVGGRWWLLLLRNKDYARLQLGVVEMPRGPTPYIVGNGKSTLVNKRGKHIDGALAFLEFMHSREYNDLINAQADALSPVIKYNYTDTFLHNPQYPNEDYNAVWRKAIENADSLEISPFVNGNAVDRILVAQTDLVKANKKSGAQAMSDAARLINRRIVEQLKIDPDLHRRYDSLVAAGARPAWDNEKDAP